MSLSNCSWVISPSSNLFCWNFSNFSKLSWLFSTCFAYLSILSPGVSIKSSAFINGVFSLKENQQHEIRTTINHLVENTKSYQLIKSVLGKNSKSAYQGRIFVNSKAQKTDGYQLSKAILLDETSEFNAKPELEIYADDVKCSHGSASGSLDENSIFYLMSRGLNYQQSKELLINGFLMDVVEKITDVEIKNLITNIIGLKQWT